MDAGTGSRRLRRAALAFAVALAGLCAWATLAQAASPAWKLLAVTGPTNLPPKQSEVQRVTVEAEGGSFALSQQTAEGEGTLSSAGGYAEITEGSNQASVFFAFEPNFAVGQLVIGSGIPEGTIITGVSGPPSEPVLELSETATETSPFTFLTAVSKEVTGVTVSSGGFQVGDAISGENIPAGTTISAVGSGTLTLSEYPTGGGTVALRGSERTAPIPYDASSSALQAALESLPAFGAGSIRVSGGPGGNAAHAYLIEFSGVLAYKDVEQLQADSGELIGEHAAVNVFTTVPGGPGTGTIVIAPTNIGGAPTSGEYNVELGPLPQGIVTSGPAVGEGWDCPGGAGQSTVLCTSTTPISALNVAPSVTVPVEVDHSAISMGSTPIAISGGATSAAYQLPVVVSAQAAPYGVQTFWAGSFDAAGATEHQAGGHPYSAQTFFLLNTVRSRSGNIIPAGDSRDAEVDLPPGFIGNPLVTPRCPQSQLYVVDSEEEGSALCNSEMRVGNFVADANVLGSAASNLQRIPGIYNDVPAQGAAAEFTTVVAKPTQSLLASVRSGEDFGVRIDAPNNPTYVKLFGAYAALQGEPEGSHGKAFLTNPTDCAEEAREAPTATLRSDSYQEPGVFSPDSVETLPAVIGCDKLQFDPSFTFQPTTTQGSSPVGATADLQIPQDRLTDPNALTTPALKKAVVTLPPGLTLNPSSANGLQSCTEAQIGYVGPGALPNPTRFNEVSPTCPDASKLGTAEIKTPLLEEPVQGTIYLAAQDENPFHSLLALYLVVDSPRFGLTLKLPGEVIPDPATGQLTATFDYNPQVPFEDLTLNFRGGGPRSELATPEVCGTYKTTGALTPWSAPESGPPATIEEAGFTVGTGCAPSAAARPFAPSFEAGTVNPLAGAYSPLVIKINRRDGEQELSRLDFTLPKGLVGKLAGIPYCSNPAIAAAEAKTGKAELAAPSCPAASGIGTVDTAAGVGTEPIHVGGHVYLAGPYKGAPLSAVVITPAVAGPFDLGDVVIRAPLYVNPETAQITTRSDQIPTILKGIPLKLRSVAISLNRPGFTLNPTNCEPMPVTATLVSSNGASATPGNRFQVGNCDALPFKPKLKLHLKGSTGRGKNPALKAVLTQPAGQANIGRVAVVLPKAEFIDNRHINSPCTRVQFNAGAGNGAECPAGSILGYAKAYTPLLGEPLQGPVYFRSNGGERELPDLVASLSGQVHLNVVGFIDSEHKKGSEVSRVRNTFALVPDAPVSRFVLNLKGGKKGLLQNSANLCKLSKGEKRARVHMVGQNGRQITPHPVISNQCGKGKKGHKHGKGHKHR